MISFSLTLLIVCEISSTTIMTLINSVPVDPPTFDTSSSVDSLIISSPFKSPTKCPIEPLERLDKASMVRETVKAYTQKLPVPSKLKTQVQQRSEDEAAEEILELKKALNTAKHDLQLEKVRNRRYENSVAKHKKRNERGILDL